VFAAPTLDVCRTDDSLQLSRCSRAVDAYPHGTDVKKCHAKAPAWWNRSLRVGTHAAAISRRPVPTPHTRYASLRDGHPEIRELKLSKAKGIRSYLPIASISHLRRLQLATCASMPDLNWTKGLNELDFFAFVDTNVASNDLSPLLDLPKLQYVGTMNKRSYNYTSDALNKLLSRRLGI
jgi:hypothetical protein